MSSYSHTRQSEACPDCGSDIYQAGTERRCGACGLIVDEQRIDRRGKRTFPDRESEERTGAPLTQARHDRGLSTEVGGNRDANGNTLSQETRRRFARLRTQHKRAQFNSKRDRNLAYACTDIARITSALGLSRDVREQASRLFRSAQSDRLLVGRSIEAFTAAAVYAVCRIDTPVRTLAEVCSVAKCSEPTVRNAYQVLNRELGLPAAVQHPVEYLPQVVDDYDGQIPRATVRQAREIARDIHDRGVSAGKHPAGVAAACLAVADERRGGVLFQRRLADAAGVTPYTIRHRTTEISKAL